MFGKKEYAGQLHWERIENIGQGGLASRTNRAKVHGGWLVIANDGIYGLNQMIFIPDPKHEWVLEPVEHPKASKQVI